jgi:hypothetical protein
MRIGSGGWELRAQIERLRRAAAEASSPCASRNLHDLPAPVRRYLRRALGDIQEVQEARIKQSGRLRKDANSDRWMTFEAEHIVVPPTTGFVWDARVRVAPLLHVRVRDALVDGRGSGHVSVAGVAIAASDEGYEMHSGSLHRYLAEAVWYPSVLLPGPTLQWTAIDDSRALATLVDHGVSVSLEFRFTGNGEVSGIYTPGRWGTFEGGYRQVPWEGHFEEYAEHDGLLVPTEADVGWYHGDTWGAVWTARMTAFDYRLVR